MKIVLRFLRKIDVVRKQYKVCQKRAENKILLSTKLERNGFNFFYVFLFKYVFPGLPVSFVSFLLSSHHPMQL